MQNNLFEETITGLQRERRNLADSEQGRDLRFQQLVGKVMNHNMQSKSVSSIQDFVEKRCQKLKESLNRTETLLRHRALELQQIEGQIRTYRNALGKIISERDELYDRFSYLIETVSDKNIQLEIESKERIRNLSQKLVNPD